LRKVNRCITEGRRAFLDRVAGIESGAECERLAPLLSRLADGEAGAEDMAALRPHLRGCLTCRATLREYRGAPSRVAALLPLLAGPHFVGRALQRLQALIVRGHDALVHAADVASAQKLAAAAAATAAIAGGGVATVASVHPGAHHTRAAHEATHRRAQAATPAAKPSATTTGSVVKPPVARSTHPTQTTASAGAKSVAKAQQEFAPSPAAATPTPSRAKPARAATGGEFGP
jgi:hypothetical protein